MTLGGAGAISVALAASLVSAAAACPTEADGFTRLASAEAEIAYRWDARLIDGALIIEREDGTCRFSEIIAAWLLESFATEAC